MDGQMLPMEQAKRICFLIAQGPRHRFDYESKEDDTMKDRI